jgi:flagellar motor protein MotB
MIDRCSWMTNVAVLVLTAGMLGGCANKRLGLERDRLMAENKDLRAALGSCQDDRAMAVADRDRLVGEVNRLQGQLATKPAMVASNTGFDAIPGVEVEQEHGLIRVKVPGDVLFSPGKVTLRTGAKRTLEQIAGVIKSQYTGNTIGIEGHTDTDPIKKSKWTDNLELSVQRAAAVHRFLDKIGIEAKNMYAAGWGQTHPRGSKAKSRRVEIVVLTG